MKSKWTLVRDIKLPSENRPRDRRLQAGEETRLLDACKQARNPWLLPVVQLALETAMRQGELIRLRWEHIDLNRRTAHLPDTKNGESRTVPLSTTAIRVLRALPRSLHGQTFPGVTTEAIKRIGAPVHPLATTTGGLLIAAPLFSMVYLLSDTPMPVSLPAHTVASILYLGVGADV